MKITKIAKSITDISVIKELNTKIGKATEENPKNGFWAIITAEDPNGDSDGDIIAVDGIKSSLDAKNGRFLPILASHNITLPNGEPPEIGRVEALVPTEVNGMKAMAMFFTFALDENDKPIDELVEKYYKRYTKGYTSAFSVGMNSLDDGEKLATGGRHYKNTELFEVSSVSIGANKHALALTRSMEDEDNDMDMDKFAECMKTTFSECFKPLEARLDLLESYLVTEKSASEPASKEDLEQKSATEPASKEDLEQKSIDTLTENQSILNLIKETTLKMKK